MKDSCAFRPYLSLSKSPPLLTKEIYVDRVLLTKNCSDLNYLFFDYVPTDECPIYIFFPVSLIDGNMLHFKCCLLVLLFLKVCLVIRSLQWAACWKETKVSNQLDKKFIIEYLEMVVKYPWSHLCLLLKNRLWAILVFFLIFQIVYVFTKQQLNIKC